MRLQQNTLAKDKILTAIFLIILFNYNTTKAQLETYELPSIYATSKTFTLSVNGETIPVTEFVVKDVVQYHYAHFSFSGEINLAVESPDNITNCEIRPSAFGLLANINGTKAEFSINEPLYLVLYINKYEKLIILADPLEEDPPQIGDPNVKNIMDYGIDNTGSTIETSKVQQALDDVAGAGGGILFFPAGIYKITRVYVKSNTIVYLAGGAVIRGTGNKQDYDEYVPGSYERITHLFTVDGATNVRFLGRGTIDGSGVSLADNASDIRDAPVKIRAISTHNSSDVHIEGIIAREVTSWSVPFYYSDHLTVSRVKVLNYTGLKHSDGINMCASQYGRVEDCFVITGDDAFCSKDYGGEPTHDIIFRNCVGYSSTRGVTFGMQAYEDMYNILYENIYMVGTRDGIDFKHDDGYGNWENILVKNVYVDECWGSPFNMHILEGGNINNITIENYQCTSTGNYSEINGFDAENKISNVALVNIKINDQMILDPFNSKFLFNGFSENIVFAEVGNDTTHPVGRMEAEDMIISNYKIDHLTEASGEKVVICDSDSGSVSYYFISATNQFDIKVSTWNESNLTSNYKLYLNDLMISSWTVGGNSSSADNEFFNHVVKNVNIVTGQKITVVGIKNGSQISGLDYVDVTPFAGYYPDKIEIEAESGVLGSHWIIENDEEASNGQAISNSCETCLENPPTDNSGIATYTIDLLEGSYKLWFRTKHPSGESSDAFWFRINANAWHKWDQIANGLPDEKYFWDVNDTDYSLNEGRNYLEVGGCEPGAMLDKIFLSKGDLIPEDTSTMEIYMEAENAIVGSEWSVLESELASGGKYIVSETISNVSQPPSDTSRIAVFNFQAIPGTYKIWIRMRHPDSIEDDSFWLRINGGDWIRWNMIAYNQSADEFHWDVNDETFSLLPGSNILEVGIRENGSELDMLFIANSGSIPPVITSIDEDTKLLPSEFKLEQNYPNPFNPSTTIKYTIPKQSNVTLKIFDILGSEVATIVNKVQPQGNYEVEFDASYNSSGIYFYRLNAVTSILPEAKWGAGTATENYAETKKMILIK